MSDTFTPEQLVEINEKIKAAEKDDTPFAVVTDNKISVIGDANKTEVRKRDYMIKFRYPRKFFETIPDGARVVGDFVVLTVNYADITLTPRKDLKVLSAIFKLKPFVQELKDDGSVANRPDEELFEVFAAAEDEIHLAVYNLVATFLGIDDFAGEYMLPGSVISALAQIIDTHPEIFNEADVFFG